MGSTESLQTMHYNLHVVKHVRLRVETRYAALERQVQTSLETQVYQDSPADEGGRGLICWVCYSDIRGC